VLTAQPIPLEVPVTIQGATLVDGSDRRELFTETTKTTLTFENGAVVSLKAKVSTGQCLFLRNEQSGREILCKVLEYRKGGPGGYTDLEFTSRDPEFWNAPATRPAAIAQNQNDDAQTIAPAATENQAAASKPEPLAPIGDEAPATLPETKASESAAPAPAPIAAIPAPADEADWNEAKDAELMAALAMMAGDAKPKPKRESAAEGKQANGHEAASENASPQDETDAAGRSTVIAMLASLPGRMREFKSAKITIAVGIAASILIVAILGLAWHAKRSASLRARQRAIAESKQSATQPTASETSQTPIAANGGPTTSSATPTTDSARVVANSNASATPAQGTDKTQQPSIAKASNDSPAAAKYFSDGPVVVEQETKRRELKQTNKSVGETIPARIISQAPPAIPSWAKGLDLDPVVQLDAVIDANGNLKTTKALSGPRILQGAAKRAVALWIFEPALTDGKPTTTHMVLTVEFQR
jgi:Gram-negative bacterial TonB protein C-terminal